jgi:tRNA A-37 threonylcarbamoyl transferase component Bud32
MTDILPNLSKNELFQIARDIDLEHPKRISKKQLVKEIQDRFLEFEEYKFAQDKYERLGQLGHKGKEGKTYLVRNDNREYAMKTFPRRKSSAMIIREVSLQRRAAEFGVSPSIIEYNLDNKFIVMEKLDTTLLDILKKQRGKLTIRQQKRILEIFQLLDQARVFHADPNPLNFMEKNRILYIIDFGMAKDIDKRIIKEHGETPNIQLGVLGFILKLKELSQNINCSYLLKYVPAETKQKFRI